MFKFTLMLAMEINPTNLEVVEILCRVFKEFLEDDMSLKIEENDKFVMILEGSGQTVIWPTFLKLMFEELQRKKVRVLGLKCSKIKI